MSEMLFPSSDGPVLVLGAAGVDMVGRLENSLSPRVSNPARIRTSYGGVARNVAANLAQLGQQVTLISVVGSDDQGEKLIQHTAAAGVDTRGVLRTDKRPTSSYLAVINPQGEREFALDDMRAIAELTPAALMELEDLFWEASLVFYDANLSKAALRTVHAILRRIHKERELPVCADPASTTLAVRLKPYLSRLSLVTPNSDEAGVLCDRCFNPSEQTNALEAAKRLVAQGVEIAIVTLAEFGLCYATSETSGYIPAMRTRIVDPTGGGDALTATVIFGLLNDIPLDDAVRLGVTAASLTLSHPGAVLPELSLELLYDNLII